MRQFLDQMLSFFIIGACVLYGCILLYRSYTEVIPSKAELEVIEGKVENLTLHENNHHIFKIEGVSDTHWYLHWFPRASEITSTIKKGDIVRLLSDAKGGRWIWQLEREDEVFINYAKISEAVKDNNHLDPFIGIACLLFAALRIKLALEKK